MKRCITTILVLLGLISSPILGTSTSMADTIDEELDGPITDLMGAPWSSFLGNQGNTGLSKYSTENNVGNLRWNYLTANHPSHPVIGYGGTIFITDGPKLLAFDNDGEIIWSYVHKFSNSIDLSVPTIGPDGTIYFASNADQLFAIRIDGKLKWVLDIDYEGSIPTVAHDGTIYVGTGSGDLLAISPEGTIKWSSRITPHGQSHPAIDTYGNIYVMTAFGYLLSLDTNGNVLWSYGPFLDPIYPPVVDGAGTIFVSGEDHLTALHNNGGLYWEEHFDETVTTPPAVDIDGAVSVGSGNTLQTFSSSGTLLQTSILRGHRTLSIRPGGRYYDPGIAIGSEGTKYIFFDGVLHALDGDRSPKWRLDLTEHEERDVMPFPAIGPDGTLYLSAENGLYAIGSGPPSMPSISRPSVGSGDIQINWRPPRNDGGSKVLQYRMFRGPTLEEMKMIATVPGTASSYQDEDFGLGTIFFYGVVAVNDYGSSQMASTRRAVHPNAPILDEIIITSPKDGEVLRTKHVKITGAAIRSWIEIGVNEETPFYLFGEGSWATESYTLEEGINHIYFKIPEYHEGDHYKEITVIVDLGDPVVVINSPRTYLINERLITIEGTAYDSSGIEMVGVSKDGETWFLADGSSEWSQDILLDEGFNNIQVRVTDNNGDTTETARVMKYIEHKNGAPYGSNELPALIMIIAMLCLIMACLGVSFRV